MLKFLIVIAIVAVIAFVLFGQYVGVRNTLVTKNEAVKASWSQVDIVLQRRADLIPNLVATVKGIAQQEQTVFGDIAKARSALLSAGTPSDKIAANGQLDGALGRLLAIVENYPQLKSNENFLQLQESWPEPKTASQSNASATTTRCRTTTPTSRNSPTTSLPDGPASNPTKPTSPRPRDRARRRR